MSRNSKRPRQKQPYAESPRDQAMPDMPDEDRGDDVPDRGKLPDRVILHQDDQVVVLDKPAAVAIEDVLAFLAAGVEKDQALDEASKASVQFLRPVYPVDRGVSGIVLLAADPEALPQLERQTAAGTLEIRYLALVRGRPGQTFGSMNRPLFDNNAGGGVVRIDEERGQPAVTDWRLLESYVGFALLECIPRTRVASQIRVHLQAEGMPLVVDPRYGGGAELMLSSFKAGYRPSRRREERPLICRLTLHAQSLTFVHPITGQQMHFESPPPKDLKAALHQLDRFGRMAP